MDDRDFMSMMWDGFTKTTHAEDAYWGYEEDLIYYGEGPGTYNLFYVSADAPDDKRYIGSLDNEADAAFITAVHGSFPDIHRRWLEALDEADQKDLEKDMAESVAADLSERLTAALVAQALANKPAHEYMTEDWHGKATQSPVNPVG
jgi:hypothetical protein